MTIWLIKRCWSMQVCENSESAVRYLTFFHLSCPLPHNLCAIKFNIYWTLSTLTGLCQIWLTVSTPLTIVHVYAFTTFIGQCPDMIDCFPTTDENEEKWINVREEEKAVHHVFVTMGKENKIIYYKIWLKFNVKERGI